MSPLHLAIEVAFGAIGLFAVTSIIRDIRRAWPHCVALFEELGDD
jgi:hypothetical protein